VRLFGHDKGIENDIKGRKRIEQKIGKEKRGKKTDICIEKKTNLLC